MSSNASPTFEEILAQEDIKDYAPPHLGNVPQSAPEAFCGRVFRKARRNEDHKEHHLAGLYLDTKWKASPGKREFEDVLVYAGKSPPRASRTFE